MEKKDKNSFSFFEAIICWGILIFAFIGFFAVGLWGFNYFQKKELEKERQIEIIEDLGRRINSIEFLLTK